MISHCKTINWTCPPFLPTELGAKHSQLVMKTISLAKKQLHKDLA
jgi:hypothetical protein